jgi:hypothetical protein
MFRRLYALPKRMLRPHAGRILKRRIISGRALIPAKRQAADLIQTLFNRARMKTWLAPG